MLEAYLERVQYQGPTSADWATLAALQRCHLAAIPYENIDVLEGRSVDLSIPALLAKLVLAGRGGYCFEQNRLFGAALLEIGFEVRPVLVRVLWHHPPGAPRPSKSHLTLVVRINDEDWLVDVGFGGSVPDQPLRLVLNHVQDTRHDKYRFMQGAEGLQLQIERDRIWEAAFEMTDGLVADADLEVANWHTSTHPQSWFRSTLAVSLCTDEARYNLYNRQFSIRRPSQPVEYQELDDAQLRDVLHQCFGLPCGFKLGLQAHKPSG